MPTRPPKRRDGHTASGGGPLEPYPIIFTRDATDPRYFARPGASYRPWRSRLPRSWAWVAYAVIVVVLGSGLLSIVLSVLGR